jgi:hypothetical protein
VDTVDIVVDTVVDMAADMVVDSEASEVDTDTAERGALLIPNLNHLVVDTVDIEADMAADTAEEASVVAVDMDMESRLKTFSVQFPYFLLLI